MPHIFEEIIASFYNRSFYNYMINQGKGIGFRFLVISSLISLIAITQPWKLYSAIDAFIEQDVPELAKSLPAIQYKDSKLSIDKPSPYSHKIGNENVNFVIDTNYKITDIDALTKHMTENNIFFLVTADKYITLKKDGIEINNLPQNSFNITHQNWIDFADKINGWGTSLIIALPLLLFFVFFLLFNLLGAIFIAIFTKILSLILRVQINFVTAIRVTAITSLPVDFICLAPLFIGMHYLQGTLSWLIMLGYIVFALLCAKEQEII